MADFDDHLRNLEYSTQNKKIYNYYFVFGIDEEYQFQIKFKFHKKLGKTKMEKFSILKPITRYLEFEELLKKKCYWI